MSLSKAKRIYDVLYGFIKITPAEWEIIHSPFYQRLRWIRQLGFSCYTFPGAEHSRFGHSIGVMENAHQILVSLGMAVSDERLMNSSDVSSDAIFHRSIRLAALLHDIGTFPFSHTTEMAYIRYGENIKANNKRDLRDDHENLGSFIIKNTPKEHGITNILTRHGISPQKISDLIKGQDPSILASQILHSEVDCDRMDYLLRDAHYTGLKYGEYDRDYLLHHFTSAQIGQERVIAIKQNALHCVEDFLMSRFAWYSQVIRSPRGAKFDAVAENLCAAMLEQKSMPLFSELLEMVETNSEKFYQFNDHFFLQKVAEVYHGNLGSKFPHLRDLAGSLLYEKSPQTIKIEEFKQRILNQDNPVEGQKILKRTWEKVEEIRSLLKRKGSAKDWILVDMPRKDIVFIQSQRQVVKNKQGPNVLTEVGPVKIQLDNGEVRLLADLENSIMAQLQNRYNFVPNVFCSASAYSILKESGIVNS